MYSKCISQEIHNATPYFSTSEITPKILLPFFDTHQLLIFQNIVKFYAVEMQN